MLLLVYLRVYPKYFLHSLFIQYVYNQAGMWYYHNSMQKEISLLFTVDRFIQALYNLDDENFY
jgi:hypothetical protein